MEHHAEEQAEQHTEEQTEEHISERTREHTDGHTEEQVEQQTEGQTERHTEGQTESQEAGVGSQSSTREPVASSESSSEVPHNTDQRSVDAQFQGLTKKCLTLDDILVYDEIAALTIRQLKEILFTNFVDYKGCCEKQELLDKVHRLYREHCENKVKAEAADDVTATGSPAGGASEEEFMCKVCMDAVVDCVLLECGHMLTCTSCGKRLSECPICRQYVTRVVHVFRS
ncbi:PREDICTED: E3 ubiquitin-protein ligase rififylin-like [Priapulus caudatus]|uniref:E3 ubiquitin-protein ligase rififylin-like n=1 Tax=Priapulus caudatus TaxID=37621 RepID=A0ABM1E288_PRICU|nr:PREDICTED: E3 ubiquitin-protein ligase rififylin-like [Priapulus caudatus]